MSCGGYTLFTPGPGQSGVCSILVSADSVHRGQQRYRLRVAAARRDDTAPGIFAPNYARMHGSLAGNRRASSGRYTLQRISRAVTKTRVSIKGRHRTTSLPGVTIPIGATMTPSVAGPVTIDVQRFDPVHGWQFFHRYSVTAHGGTVTVSFRPPSVGRWRAKPTFEGTRSASPSVSGFAEVLVARPIPT